MNHIMTAVFAAAAFAIVAGAATAQEMGDAKRGHLLAETVCSECGKICAGISGLWAHEKAKHGALHTYLSIHMKQEEETLAAPREKNNQMRSRMNE